MGSVFSALNLAVMLMLIAFVIGNANIFIVPGNIAPEKGITGMSVSEPGPKEGGCNFFCRLNKIISGKIETSSLKP